MCRIDDKDVSILVSTDVVSSPLCAHSVLKFRAPARSHQLSARVICMWTKRSPKRVCLGNVVCSAAALCRYFLLEPLQRKHCLFCLPPHSTLSRMFFTAERSERHGGADRGFSVTPGSWPKQTR